MVRQACTPVYAELLICRYSFAVGAEGTRTLTVQACTHPKQAENGKSFTFSYLRPQNAVKYDESITAAVVSTPRIFLSCWLALILLSE